MGLVLGRDVESASWTWRTSFGDDGRREDGSFGNGVFIMGRSRGVLSTSSFLSYGGLRGLLSISLDGDREGE